MWIGGTVVILVQGKKRGGRDAMRIATDERRRPEPKAPRPAGVAGAAMTPIQIGRKAL
jgi:hypothetical protein